MNAETSKVDPRPGMPGLGRFLFQMCSSAAVMGAALGSYLLALKWRGPAAAWITQTEWDRHIPFMAGWVWVYLIPYAVGPVIIGFLSRATFGWYVRRAIFLQILSVGIFLLLPSRTVRPSTDALDSGLTATMYRNMVEIDEPPANAAPSLHVSLTCLLGLALMRDYPRWWPVAWPAVVVVWASTLLTHQHHLIDVGTGALLGIVVALPWNRRGRNRALQPLP
jgi:membrane-associated phospholipid phosphatase